MACCEIISQATQLSYLSLPSKRQETGEKAIFVCKNLKSLFLLICEIFINSNWKKFCLMKTEESYIYLIDYGVHLHNAYAKHKKPYFSFTG